MSQPHANSCDVCLLTPPGRGAVATLVLAGPAAAEALGQFFRPSTAPANATEVPCLLRGRIYHGRWRAADGEEIVVCRTGAHEFEIHCHGGMTASQRLLDDLWSAGATQVSWRDWLASWAQRSIEGDALAAITAAPTGRTANILLDQFHGALAGELRDAVADLARGEGELATRRLQELLARAPIGRHLIAPLRVVLAGLPNVGKSSLVNALLGYERSIVFDAPGTTRDVVTGETAVDGWPVKLADTAGLRTASDSLETAGIEHARDALDRADLVVLVFDASSPAKAEEDQLRSEFPSALVVHNKCDLIATVAATAPATIRTSAVTGQGLGELLAEIGRRLVPNPPSSGAAVPFMEHQVEAIERALAALERRQVDSAAEVLSQLLAPRATTS